ncbi:hypothetical protein GCM10009639_53760 [Kitasatospora putterlickiae]|uniref:Uncharacterized protein n=1 Tax=Kitasatospora putterlickiae TaxID=221725 RepID=A0ABP4J5W0_9ACTN
MIREHTPPPGITWTTTVSQIETVVPDNVPESAPRPNRATRRALARATRKTANR